jgi:hypothetical protein
LNSGEKLLFLGRVKIIYLPGIILMDDCPGSSGHLNVEVMDERGTVPARRRLPEGVTGTAGLHGLIGGLLGEDDEAEVIVGIETVTARG